MRPAAKKNRPSSLQADWNHPTGIRFGVGRIRELPEVCWKLGVARPLVVTDRRLVKKPFFKKILMENDANNIRNSVFSRIEAEPDGAVVNQGARMFLQGGFDGLIAVGGGSVLDAAKAMALSVAVGPRNLWSCRFGRPGVQFDPARTPTVIAVPTTAGTGSEVDANAVITSEDDQAKVSLYHPTMMPRVVIADPELTRGLIPYLTAATGFDALSHNLEAFCSPMFHPILDAIALQGVRYIKDWLPRVFYKKGDLTARSYVMAASIMGAIAFEKGLGAMHGLAHAVGALYKVQHGRTIAAVMPYVLKYNRKSIEGKAVELARYLDLPQHSFEGLLDWTAELRFELGLPACLGDLGVKPEDADLVVEKALQDGNMAYNPAPVDAVKIRKLVLTAVRGG